MTNLYNTLLVGILMLNLLALGTRRIVALIRTVALQGALVALLPLLSHDHLSLLLLATIIPAMALKGLVIPVMMQRALSTLKITREVEPLIGLQASVLLGACGTVAALLFADRLPLAAQHTGLLLVPTAIATLFTGFVLLTTRFKALTQVLGYLILENGIFIFSLLLVGAMPLVIELGMLLDLFVGIFVICIIVNHINRAFASTDTRRLVSLKE